MRIILCTADVWKLRKRAEDLEQIAGVHVRTKPFDVDEMLELIARLVAERASVVPDIQPAIAEG